MVHPWNAFSDESYRIPAAYRGGFTFINVKGRTGMKNRTVVCPTSAEIPVESSKQDWHRERELSNCPIDLWNFDITTKIQSRGRGSGDEKKKDRTERREKEIILDKYVFFLERSFDKIVGLGIYEMSVGLVSTWIASKSYRFATRWWKNWRKFL